MPGPPSAADLDVGTLRRSWPTLIGRLREEHQQVLAALLESVTPASFDGETLELAFPPERRFGVSRVEQKADALRDSLRDVFGIAPTVRCVVREAVVGGPEVDLEDEEPPLPEEAALAMLRAELDAEPETGP
ncbi:MAG: hypothetical protein HY658_14600 [Actinobacteria bacterium]|nr:hypothetical protein [Actinomycetota bacterium]